MYFNANCRMRGSSESRIWPNVAWDRFCENAPVPPPAAAKVGLKLLVTLYASTRASIRFVSFRRNTRDNAMSKDQVGGPTTELRPVLPRVPSAGCAKAAGLSQFVPGLPDLSP